MPSRRTFLAASAAVPLGVLGIGGGPAFAGRSDMAGLRGAFRRLERAYDARIGAFGHNLVSGVTVAYRAGERFPMCSVFKTLAASAVMRDLDQEGEFLAKRVRYSEADLAGQYAPIAGTAEHLANGMTVEELCAATVSHSDNTAANLLLRELGGPSAITRFCRSLADPVTRLDRWEPELNSAEPWRLEDTTSPEAITRTYTQLIAGDALTADDRRRLTGWLLDSTTNAERFRAGLPQGWTSADKTGSGDYGTANDVGIAWTPDGTPLALAVLTTKPATTPDTPWDNRLVAETTALLAAALS